MGNLERMERCGCKIFYFDFNQFGHEDKWGPPIFKIALKNDFTSIPSDKSRGTENHKSLRI